MNRLLRDAINGPLKGPLGGPLKEPLQGPLGGLLGEIDGRPAVVYADCGKGMLQGFVGGDGQDGYGAGLDGEGKEDGSQVVNSNRDGAGVGVEEGLEEGGGTGGGRQGKSGGRSQGGSQGRSQGRVRLDMLPDRLHPGAKGMQHLLPCVKAAVDRAKGAKGGTVPSPTYVQGE